MAHDAPATGGAGKTVIRNIGLMLSGAMEKPILDADTIVAEDGRIAAVGRAKDSTRTAPRRSSTRRAPRSRRA